MTTKPDEGIPPEVSTALTAALFAARYRAKRGYDYGADGTEENLIKALVLAIRRSILEAEGRGLLAATDIAARHFGWNSNFEKEIVQRADALKEGK